MSVTHQRQVIYSALQELEGHPSPEAVYERVRRRIPSVSLATVYKNLRTFAESGLIREVSLHHGSTRLETNAAPHHHLVCSRCRTIIDLEESAFVPPRLKRKAPGGFKVQRFLVEVIGLCEFCTHQ